MERGRGERARSLALLGPSEDPCIRPWRLAADVGPPPALALLRPLPLSPHPHRGGPWVVPLSRPAVPFRFSRGWCASVPRRGKGSAPRRHPAVAPGRSRLGARRVSSRRRSPLPRFRPRPLSGYLATASRRVGLKTPGGSPFRPRGRGDGGARRGPSWRLPRTPVPEAAGLPFPRHAAVVAGSGSPPWAPVGLASACPVRRCVVGRGPRVCRSRPAS